MITTGTSTLTGRDVPCPDRREIQRDLADLWYAVHVLQDSAGNRFGPDPEYVRRWWRTYRDWGGTGN